MIEINDFSRSQAYFEPALFEYSPAYSSFLSLEGRWIVFKTFLKKIFVLPFSLLYKIVKTAFRILLAIWGILKFVFTMGYSVNQREFLLKRMRALSKDVIDWVVFPFAVGICFTRMLLGSLIHPRIYFGI